MKPEKSAKVDLFAGATKSFSETISWVREDRCPDGHAEFEKELEEKLRELGRLVYQGRLDALFAEERERVLKGRRPAGVARVRSRQVESGFGRVAARRHGFTKKPEPAYFPLDERLKLPLELYSHRLRQRISEEVRTQSVENAVARVDEMTGGHVPKRQALEQIDRAARDFDTFYAERERTAPVNDTVEASALLMMSSDSKGILVVPDALKDATRKASAEAVHDAVKGDPTATRKDRKHTKRMATVTAVWNQEYCVRTAVDIVSELHREEGAVGATTVRLPRPQNKHLAATVQDTLAVAIGEMFDEADRRDPERKRTTGVLIDGHEHQREVIQKEASRHDRPVTIIIDLLHVLHYIWLAGKAARRGNSERMTKWMRYYLIRLLTVDPVSVIVGIQRAANLAKLTAEERVPVDDCLKYLRNNLSSLHYADFLARGFPIASGVIEGACRHLIQDRLGITGARWGLRSAEAVLRLRALFSNGDWPEYWDFHLRQEHERTYRALAA